MTHDFASFFIMPLPNIRWEGTLQGLSQKTCRLLSAIYALIIPEEEPIKMSFRKYLILCVVLIWQALWIGSDSQTTVHYFADSVGWQNQLDTLHEISEINVVANRHAEVIPVQHLEGEALQQLSVQSVADAVRYFSGIQIKDYGGVGGLKTVDLRSMGTNHLGVFYDGIEIGNAQNGIVDLGKFSMDNIEQLSLYNGQKSNIFQSAKDFGSAGTLYIKTRRPHFKPNKPYNIEVGIKTGSFGLANPSILYEHKINNHISASANLEYTFATGKYPFRYRRVNLDGSVAWDTTAIRQNGDVQAWRAEAGVFGVSDNGKWHAKGYFYDSNRGIPGAIVNNIWTNSQRQWDRNAFVQASWQHNFASNYDLMLNAKYSYDYMRYLNPDTTLMYIDNSFKQQEVYLSCVNRYHIYSFWDIALSADYMYNYLRSDMTNFVFPQRNTFLLAAATSLDWKWLKAEASVLGTFVWDKLKRQPRNMDVATRQSSHYFTPSVALSYQPLLSERFFIRAFYKRIFRMPTFNDLYYTDMGNISLKPEYTNQYNVGLAYDKRWNGIVSDVGGKIDAYFISVDDKIVAIPKGNGQYRWQMMNFGHVEILGTDVNAYLNLAFQYDIYCRINLNYTFQRAQDLTNPNDNLTYRGQIPYIPWHSGSVVVNLSWKDLSLNYSFIYVGERYCSSANIPVNYEQPWYTHDMSLTYRREWKKIGLHLSLEVNNMLNQQYDVIRNYPMPGRNYRGVVKFLL